MSDTKKGTQPAPTEEQRKGFKELDYKQGTFQLWDKIFQCYRTWKVDNDSSPGIGMLNDKIEKESQELRKYFPDDFHNLSRSERIKSVSDYIAKMPDDKKQEYLNRVKRNSDKQLAVIAGYIEPMCEIPDIWENKIEFLASCLSTEQDTALINDFFLRRLVDSTTLQEESPKQKNKGKK